MISNDTTRPICSKDTNLKAHVANQHFPNSRAYQRLSFTEKHRNGAQPQLHFELPLDVPPLLGVYLLVA